MRLIDADALKDAIEKAFEKANLSEYEACVCVCEIYDKQINNAPTVEAFTKEDIKQAIKENFDIGYEMAKSKLAEKLNDRIEERVCKYCQMNKHCELCEISRVFSIIALTNEEMKGGKE